MRQRRITIGCQEWQETVSTLGLDAAALYLYLRTLMRTMQAAEITVTVSEIAEAVKLPTERVKTALAAICVKYLERENNADGTVTLRDRKEAAAQADIFRKRAARLLLKSVGAQSRRLPQSRTCPGGQSDGQSGVLAANIENLSEKSFETDFFMIYSGPSDQKEKKTRTQKKEKSLTENTGRADTREAELPVDALEAEFIDVCGSWPPSLRKAVCAEKEDVRESFYLYVRQREAEDSRKWTSDQVRIALLAVKRIPEERRAESILAASMGHWKTIRDAGSGVYFEKDTGRVVSLVRGTVEYKPQNETEKTNAELAVTLARNMRRG